MGDMKLLMPFKRIYGIDIKKNVGLSTVYLDVKKNG